MFEVKKFKNNPFIRVKKGVTVGSAMPFFLGFYHMKTSARFDNHLCTLWSY